jgi:hypothetical protein
MTIFVTTNYRLLTGTYLSDTPVPYTALQPVPITAIQLVPFHRYLQQATTLRQTDWKGQ